jgi:hypothetical protein
MSSDFGIGLGADTLCALLLASFLLLFTTEWESSMNSSPGHMKWTFTSSRSNSLPFFPFLLLPTDLLKAPMRQNLPILLGLLGIWNSTFMGHETRAILPYGQALLRFPAHIQQVRDSPLLLSRSFAFPLTFGTVRYGEQWQTCGS